MIELLGTGGTIPIPDETINNFANGTLSPLGGWIADRRRGRRLSPA